MLNTDLHGEKFLQKRISFIEFTLNLSKQNDGDDFSNDLLKDIYYNIRDEAISWGTETEKRMEMETTSSSVPHLK